jgi:hypothetical protein
MSSTAVCGHAAVDANQLAGGIYVLLPAHAQFDTALAGLTGVTGWILPLSLTHRLPVRNPPGLADNAASQSPSVAAGIPLRIGMEG